MQKVDISTFRKELLAIIKTHREKISDLKLADDQSPIT